VDEGNYLQKIAAASGDPVALRVIADELQAIGGATAGRLRLMAIQKRMATRSSHAGSGATSTSPSRFRPGWLEELGIEAVDGRPLFRYGISEEAFHELKVRLRERRAAFTAAPSRDLAGQFVLWAAEWFRRRYAGTGLSWDELNAELGARCEWRHWQRLADKGLRFWRIPPLMLNGRHYRLAAIARQGGFPMAALEGAQGGWAQRYLEKLVATLAATPSPDFDAASLAAERLIGMVPATWQNQGMRVVSAELAMEVVRLRQLAESEGVPAGALVSIWLDKHLPGWREELPLSIGSDAGRALIDGLLRTVALRGGHEAVRCYRWLELGSGGRREGVNLELAGLLDGKALSGNLSSDWSRLRLYPSGQFAQHVAGELAVADPDEDGAWRARPSTKRTHFALPANVAITAELRGDGQRVGSPFVLAGGETVTSDLRVYTIESETDETAHLKLVGSASGAFRDDQLVVDVPTSWSVEANGDSATCEPYALGRTLERSPWKVSGAAIVTNVRGDRYLLRTDQNAATRDRLLLNGSNASFELDDPAYLLIIGTPSAQVEEQRRPRGASYNELFWRPAGASQWQPGIGGACAGLCEFAWRDRETRHIRDRRDAVVLPAGFTAQSRRVGDWLEFSVEGWPGAATAAVGSPQGENCWRLRAKANTRSRFKVTLSTATGSVFDIALPIRHQAWIENWADGPLPREARLSLSAINRYVARTTERCELMADLLDENGRSIPQGHVRWWVEGEMPLSTIRDDLAALLRPGGRLRASIRLNFNDANEDYWFVKEFEHELDDERGGLTPEPAVAEPGVRVVRRVLHDPTREQDAGQYDLLDSLNHRPIILPRQQGDALVYLRADDRVLSSPRLVRSAIEGQAQNPLGRAMSLADWHERQAALEQLLLSAVTEPTSNSSRALVRQLIDLAMSLDGLPPATFDALRIAGSHTEIATMMLFQARRDELEPLLRLTEGLPFSWWLAPKAHWDAAAEAQAEFLFDRIPGEFALVAGSISETRAELALLEPILAPLLDQPGRPPGLETAANSFLNRSSDRMGTWNSNPFRARYSETLPTWRFGEHFWRALDAPVVAALAALERAKLNEAELMAAKDIAWRHPLWFREGFAAALKEI
jgi:hypothetical protein